MEQAMIGLSPNPLILSYLKYAVSSQVRNNICWFILMLILLVIVYIALLFQMVSYASVLTAISKVNILD